MFKYKKTIVLMITMIILLTPLLASAAPLVIVPDCAREKAKVETPGVDCIVFTMINIAKLILGISGSVALALFIYGGFLMLISSGSEQMVTKGKNVLSGAVIGLIIVFVAYTGIFFLVKTLTSGSKEAPALFACLDVESGAYKEDGTACGESGGCKAGVCVAGKDK